MKVYVEFVVINNFAVNMLLLYWASIIAKRPVKWFFTVLSALIGTVFAVFLPFAGYKAIIIFKILLPFVMCATLHNYGGFKQYCAVFALFCGLTFLLGGGVLALANSGRADVAQYFDFNISVLSGVIAALLLLFTYLAKLFVYRFSALKRRRAFECEVIIHIGAEMFSATGYLDSGNKLYYKNAIPVIVVDKTVLGNNMPVCKHKIKVKTVTDERYLDGFFPDSIELIENGQARSFDNVAACVSEKALSGYKVILHGDMAC